jgi:beta-lactamase superfamily II metal-dependent hydrolase
MKTVRPDELEISLFGPGYGESVVVHMGANQWVIIDSCRDPVNGLVAPLEYLRKMGVDPCEAVALVVAAHWHDDHVRGLSNIVQTCSNARFVCASAMSWPEFVTVVTRYEGALKTPAGSGVREMYELLHHLSKTARQPYYASPNRLIFRSAAVSELAGGPCEIWSLSPSDRQLEMFWSEISHHMPEIGHTVRRAVSKSPNHLAIALWLTVGKQSVLLGSDLQETRDPETGWSVIVQSPERPAGSAAVFKIPHHGSENGHSDEVWEQMIGKDAHALLTPFTNGNVCLPTTADVKRVSNRAGAAYITANSQVRPRVERSPLVARAIRTSGVTLKLAEPNMGHIRLRKRYGGKYRWYIALMRGAYRI